MTLTQQTLLSARSSLHDFIHEEYAYIGYLSKYIHRLQYVYNRQGEIIEPFSIHLPEEVPYKNKVICVEREKLDGDCFDIEVGDSLYYKACCEDPENLSYYSGMDRIYCLVTDNKKQKMAVLRSYPVRKACLSRLPFARKRYASMLL